MYEHVSEGMKIYRAYIEEKKDKEFARIKEERDREFARIKEERDKLLEEKYKEIERLRAIIISRNLGDGL
ncbi:MAG: hypothetical protein ACI4S4_01200 [Candidatus Ornithospirochaeta sp.]